MNLDTFIWQQIPPLTTPRLHLRALTVDDRPDLFAIYGDPEVMQYASDPVFPDLSYVDQMLTSMAWLFKERHSLEWGIVLRESQRVIGTCGLHSFSLDRTIGEIGCLLQRAYWGQSLMHEALERVITFGFHDLALHAIRAEIDLQNSRSIRLFQRLNFQVTSDEDLERGGDEVCYYLFRPV